MKNILIISFSDITGDPRVMRQISALRKQHRISVIGFGPAPEGIERLFPLTKRKLSLPSKIRKGLGMMARRYEAEYWAHPYVVEAMTAQLAGRPDLVVANDIDAVPVALKLGQGRPVLFDAHEYSPREFEESLAWRATMGPYKEYLCRQYIPRVAAMTTVGAGLAEAYRRNFGADAAVIYNAPFFVAQKPSPVRNPIRLIHHGGVNPSRRLEGLLEMMPLLDQRFTLDLMLVPNGSDYFHRLEKNAAGAERVRMVPPVPMMDLPVFLNQYDIGVYSLPPTNFNNANALPNKFFEFVQGRLAVAVGPTPEMAALTKRFDMGIVAEDFSPAAMAAALNRIAREDVIRYKQNADMAAEELCYESSEKTLARVVEAALSGQQCIPEQRD